MQNLSKYNSSVTAVGNNGLPPIRPSYSSGGNVNTAVDLYGINHPTQAIPGMVSQNNRGASSKNLIYRSIPPKPHTFTLSDMIGEGLAPQKGPQNKKLGLTGSSSSEFAKRFMSRPTTQPKVVEFTAGKMGGLKRRRGINGFFPPVKLRGHGSAKLPPQTNSQPTEVPHIVSMSAPPPIPTASTSTTTHGQQPQEAPLQLVPTAYSEVRPKSSRSLSRASRASRASRHSTRKTPESVRTAPPMDSGIIYPETFDFDDSRCQTTTFPSPKRVLPRRDLPWVFRYKVKRNMNELSKIMANKNPQLVDV